MPGSLEHQVISKTVESRAFAILEKQKITEKFFFEDDCRDLYLFLKQHYHADTTYGDTPSWDYMTMIGRPGFQYVYNIVDTLETLCVELRNRLLRSQIIDLAEDLRRHADVSPQEGLKIVREAAASLAAEHDVSDDLLLSGAYDQLAEEYEIVQEGGGLTGIPWPWEVLNQETLGMHPGDLIIIYGRPKSGKTWHALNAGVHAYLRSGQRVLIFSMEMMTKNVQRRCACLLAGIDYGRFRKGQLLKEEYDQVFGWLWHLRENHNDNGPDILATSNKDEGGGGISSLRANIQEFRPHLVIVDGLYLMRDDRQGIRSADWKAIAHISRDLKQTAVSSKIPIIGVTQGKRDSAKNPKEADLMELSYADAIGQDADKVIRISRVENQQTHEFETILSFPGSREEGNLDAFVTAFHPGGDFSWRRTITQGDMTASESTKGSSSPGQKKIGMQNLPIRQWKQQL